MADGLDVVTIKAADGGLDVDSHPESISPTRAPELENLLVDRPGKLLMRGPINESIVFNAAGPERKVTGAWTFADNLLIGLRAASTTAIRDPWVVPYRGTASADVLADADVDEMFHVDLLTGTLTTVNPTDADNVPGPRYARIGPKVYGIGFDSATAAVNENGSQRKLTSILAWDGSTTEPTVYANAPRGGQDIIDHYQRLFVLGGRNPDASGNIKLNTLWYSDPMASDTTLTDNKTAWTDDTDGLINQIIVGSEDNNDFGVALARVGQNLVIFKRRSIYMLTGYSKSTFLVRPVTKEIGCLDARSVQEYGEGVFFMSDEGMMYFDGSSLKNVSDAPGVRSSLLPALLAAVGDRGADGGRAFVTSLDYGYLAVSVGVSTSASEDASTTSFSALYYPATDAWSMFSSDAFLGGYPVTYARARTRIVALDDEKLVRVDKVPAPETELADATRGVDTASVLFHWTDPPPEFSGTEDTLVDDYGIEAFPDSITAHPIKARWKSRLVRLAPPFYKAQLSSFQMDYRFVVSDGAEDAEDGWYVKLMNSDGSLLVPEFQVPSQGDPSEFESRKRFITDIFAETNELQVEIAWRDESLSLPVAELHNLAVLFQTSHQRARD